MKIYIEHDNYDTAGDLFASRSKVYRDDNDRFWIEGEGGAGTVFAKPDGAGGTRSGSLKYEIKKDSGYTIGVVNQMFGLGMELPRQFWEPGLVELDADLSAAGYRW